MSTITTINENDIVKDSRATINTNFQALNTDLIAAEADVVALEAVAPTAGQKAALAGETSGGTPSDSNRFVSQNSSLFGSSTFVAGETISGATLPVPVYQNTTDDRVYACDGNDTARLKFLGFATTTATVTNNLTVRLSGLVSGFTGLIEGESYYVQDAVGTIGLTPGTSEVLVGVAISSTQLLISKGKRYTSGTQLFSATATATITTGFRVSRVRVHAVMLTTIANDVPKFSNGGWTQAGGNDSVGVSEGTSSETQGIAVNNAAWYIYSNSATSLHQGVVDTITNTTFRLNNTKTGSPDNIQLFWEAEGDI